MFNQISYKYKFYSLLLFLVILGITAYKRSFRHTFLAIGEHKILQEKQSFVRENIQDLDKLINKSNYLDKLIGEAGISSEIIQQNILEFVANYRSAEILKLKEIHFATNGKFKINSYELVVFGDYKELSELIYLFEKKFNLAKIVSIEYFKKKNYKTKKEQLFVKLIFQNYEKK